MRSVFTHPLRLRFPDLHRAGIGLLVIFFLSALPLHAQDTTKSIEGLPHYTLSEEVIQIRVYRWYEIGRRVTYLDSAKLAQLSFSNAAEALATLTTASVKNYGPGGIAVLSTRGTTAEHTKVFWMGMPLNSPSLGLVDLSLLPVEAFDGVNLAHGGTSSGAGSNATGGSVFLENWRLTNNKFRAQLGLFGGSFNDRKGYLKLQAAKKGFSSTSLLYAQQAQNDFPFENRAFSGDSLMRRMHAALHGLGLMQHLSLKIKEKQEVFASVWLQQSERQVPAAITIPVNGATQQDSSLRLVVGGKKYLGSDYRTKFSATAGTSWEKIRYADSASGLVSRSFTKLWFAEVSAEQWLPHTIKLSGGGSMSLLQGTSDGYAAPVQEGRHSAFARLEKAHQHYSWYVHLRQDLAPGRTPPLCPGAGIQKQWLRNKNLVTGATVSRLFNLPTLNMRYWSPGGNPALKPERGWSADVIAKYALLRSKWEFQTSLTGFSILLNDWIQWQPQSGNIWSPLNLKQVWSRGAEASVHVARSMKYSKFAFDVQYAFTRSTTLQSNGSAQDLIGHQLIYVPLHNANATLCASHSRWTAGFTQVFTGSRYTEADNSASLPAYALTHLFVSCNLRLHAWQWSLSLRLNNLFNTYYESVNWMPMPGRSFMIGLRTSFLPSPKSTL